MADLAPISEEVFDQKRAEMVSANASAFTDVQVKCKPCSKVFKSAEQLNQHKESKKHKKNEKEYIATQKVKGGDVSEDSLFKSISNNVDSRSIQSEQTGNLVNILDGLNQEEIKSKATDENTSEIKIPKTTALESLRCCLFCNKEFDGVKKCIDHMRIQHCFTILDIDCLVDLKGLLNYMAQRIQLGKLCLFCTKQFKDPVCV